MCRISFGVLLAVVLFPLPANAEVLLTTFGFHTPFFYARDYDTPPSSVGMKFGGTDYESIGFPLRANPVISYVDSDPPWSAPIDYTFEPNIEDVTLRVDSGANFEQLAAAFSTSKYVTEDSLIVRPSPYDPDIGVEVFGLAISNIWGSTGFIPPNGVSLEGTPYTLSAVEFKLISLEARPLYESLGDFDYIYAMQYAFGFTVSLYGQAPEPTTGTLAFGIALLVPIRRRYL